MIYLSIGLYAEGPTDYHFLRPLLVRHLDALAAQLFPADYEIADTTLGMDNPLPRGTPRAEQIAAAIAAYAGACEIFVIHSDGAGDPDGARATCVDPGISAACAALPDRAIVAVGCVPVREIEAWLLTDQDAFQALLGSAIDPQLPAAPEKEIDPKATLQRILKEGRVRPGPESVYAFFGERVRFATLRALPAFRRFESDMVEAIKRVAESQGYRG